MADRENPENNRGRIDAKYVAATLGGICLALISLLTVVWSGSQAGRDAQMENINRQLSQDRYNSSQNDKALEHRISVVETQLGMRPR